MRAASRGTSYKRLQSMLSQSPTPIDFSRAQIAGLKTRNELTQKVLEVTDEIGDAHIKVPIRVAGARNREYVLVRNKGDKGGFALGVVQSGVSEEKAIAVDEDSASAFTSDDEREGRMTDEEVELVEVAVEASPEKRSQLQDKIPEALLRANPNDPAARKEVARELLQRRTRALAKDKAREQGVNDEWEEMEEQLRRGRELYEMAEQSGDDVKGAGKASLFRKEGADAGRHISIGSEASDGEDTSDGQKRPWEATLDEREVTDVNMANETKSDAGEEEMELEEVQTHTFEADDYSSFYGGGQGKTVPPLDEDKKVPSWITASPHKTDAETKQADRKSATLGGPALGFRLQDRSGQPEGLDRRLLAKRRWEHESDAEDEEPGPSSFSSPEPPPSPLPSFTAPHTSQHSRANSIVATNESGKDGEQTNERSSDAPVSPARKSMDDEVKAVAFQDRAAEVEWPASVVEPISLSDSESPPPTHPSSPLPLPSVEREMSRIGEGGSPSSPSTIAVASDQESEPPSSPGEALNRSSPDIADMEGDLRKETVEEIALDTLSSVADEVTHDPHMDSGRLSEDEHSDYSNQGRDEASRDGSASPTPPPEVLLGPDGFPLPTSDELAAMDAEDEAELGEMDNDQDEFVSFLSRAKGQGLNEVRKEVEAEVAQLRSEHATTRRSEGEVTQQMAKEIQFMLRLFGLPYITAPMEAEAQCAELISLKLADGIITDDSDVFLFGGTFIYKNMFNNKKYVECYKLSDLQHDLGMDRTKLVQLAYLLGSDYTEGLEGVGPVLAMEILAHFPGEDGLVKFREWWLKVQTGKDTAKDTYDSTLKRLKRTLRNKVHLESHWPDANVIDAYFAPTVDSSREGFQWGLPDLDSLRSFFAEYLRWDKDKTDHYLIPAIEAQNRRSRRMGTQSTLDRGNFFDLTAGDGPFAGRQRPTYNSTRLQQVIKNFRASGGKAQNRQGEGAGQVDLVSSEGEGEEGAQPAVRKQGAARKRKAGVADKQSTHEQEWRPAKAKRKASIKQPGTGATGTSLSQARNMSLDSVDGLPPSRGERRGGGSSRAVRARPIVLADGDESSSLSEG